jgi:uracil phosphoribosyltransferase
MPANSSQDNGKLVVLDHPLIAHKLTFMRDVETPTVQFRRLLKEISLLMGYEVTRGLPLTDKQITTPVADMTARVMAGRKPAIVSILRAGLGMAEGLHELIPSAREGHVGLYRDPETHRPVEYYAKIPSPEGRPFFVVDPMLATGYSAVAAIDVLNKKGVDDAQITFLALVAAPEGVAVFHEAHPSITIYTASLDERLNEHAYIVPGLGDAWDRLFGTK